MSINEMFANNNSTATTSQRTLAGTAALTSAAHPMVKQVMDTINADPDAYKDAVTASQTDADEMDKLIKSIVNLDEQDTTYLNGLEDTVLDSMLKSQQSKRSRLKSHTMTIDNYTSMMLGAVCELLLRKHMGKSKTAGGYRSTGITELTPEAAESLKADQDKLRKEIRNVQSKKSIMKSKEGFTETDERWISLCALEDQLKALREGTTHATVVKVDETKEKLAELLGDTDISSLKASNSKELLEKIKQIIG